MSIYWMTFIFIVVSGLLFFRRSFLKGLRELVEIEKKNKEYRDEWRQKVLRSHPYQKFSIRRLEGFM